MRVAVTGAAGFVGQNLLAELETTDHTVIACDVQPMETPEAVESRQLDITDAGAVDALVGEVDAVAHLAAHPLPASLEAPVFDAEINIMGSLNILDAARRHELEKLVFASSSAVVGAVEAVPVGEDHPVNPRSPYAVAKRSIEQYLRVYDRLYDLPYLAFRFFNVYGPHQPPQSGALVPVVLSRLHRHEGVYVTGEGSQTRDFIFSGDVARFLRMGLEEPVRGQLVNLGRGVQTSIRDAIAVMGEVVGVDPRVEHRDPRPDEIDDFYADMSRCEQLFGEVPATGLRAGVERTYEWLAPRLEH